MPNPSSPFGSALRLFLLLGVWAFGAAAAAETLVNGGAVAGTISLPGERDNFTFDVAAGQRILLQVVNTGSGTLTPRMEVYDPSGTYVDGGQDQSLVRVDVAAAATGTHTVAISHGNGYGGIGGDYLIYYVRAPGADELGPLVNGGKRQGDIDFGDLDSFTFFANAGESVILQAVNTGTGTLSPHLQVFAPDGTLIGDRRDVGIARVDLALGATGVYTVVMSHERVYGYGGGPYDLYFVRTPGAGELGGLVNGGRLFGFIDYGDLDSYTFHANAGESIQVVAADESVDRVMAPRLQLFAPAGYKLADGSDISAVTFNWTAESTGTYTAVVSHNGVFGGGGGAYSASLNVAAERFSYAALGDSYSSGEGVWPYRNPADTGMTGCHRSTRAYPTLVRAPGNGTPIAQRSDGQFDFFACTGAVSANVRAGGEPREGQPPQLSPGNAVNASRDLVTLSIGGNDAKFVPIVAFCLAHKDCNGLKPFKPYSNLTLGELSPLLLAFVASEVAEVHAQVRSAASNATVLVLGYPILLSGTECFDATLPPFKNAKLSATEQAFLRDLNAQVNQIIEASAALAGLHFVPVAEVFKGHEVCGKGEPWIQGVNIFDLQASFHPTARGQQAYADAANGYLGSLRTGAPYGLLANGLPRNPPPAKPGPMARTRPAAAPMPRFGELSVRQAVAPLGCPPGAAVLAPGQAGLVQGAGFLPGESVSLSLVVDRQTFALGTALADAAGVLEATVTVPSEVPDASSGTVEALGGGPDGAGLLSLSLVRIDAAAGLDSDGDGIADACDTCTLVPNPDQRDTNSDGYGNACDADLDNNGIVDKRDRKLLKAALGRFDDGLDADLDGNRSVDASDLALLDSLSGKPPGPAAIGGLGAAAQRAGRSPR